MHLTALVLGLLVQAVGPADVDAGESPDQAVDRLTAVVQDPHAEPALRSQAVQGLGVLLGTTEQIVKFEPGTELVVGFVTGGFSEILLRWFLRKSVVSPARFGDVAKTLGQAFCDPVPEVRAAARRVLHDAASSIAAQAYTRALSCPDSKRSAAAVQALQAEFRSAGEGLRFFGRLPTASYESQALEAGLQGLQTMASGGSPSLRPLAAKAISSTFHALEADLSSAVAKADDEKSLALDPETMASPLWGPPLRGVVPALRKRLRDSNLSIRQTVATDMWLLQERSPPALEALVAAFGTDLTRPAALTSAQRTELLRAVREAEANPAEEPLTLERAVQAWGPRAEAATPALQRRIAKLREDHQEISLPGELFSLTLIGRGAASAAPELERCLAIDTIFGVRRAAAVALAFVTRDPKYLPILREPDSGSERERALRALGILELDPDDAAARKELGLGVGPLAEVLTRRAIIDPLPVLNSMLPLFYLQETRP